MALIGSTGRIGLNVSSTIGYVMLEVFGQALASYYAFCTLMSDPFRGLPGYGNT